jgi:DNA-binding response OmpR family regulator
VPAAAASAHTLVVLVVEDDRRAREMFRTALREEGYNVVAVGDGIDALTYLGTHNPPSAVVLDLGLPRLHGRDVLLEMAAQGLTQAVPVIIVTGESRPLVNELDYACVLRKPLGPDELIAAVRGCIAKARTRSEE